MRYDFVEQPQDVDGRVYPLGCLLDEPFHDTTPLRGFNRCLELNILPHAVLEEPRTDLDDRGQQLEGGNDSVSQYRRLAVYFVLSPRDGLLEVLLRKLGTDAKGCPERNRNSSVSYLPGSYHPSFPWG